MVSPTPAGTDLTSRYELLDELGRGGFGVVVRARQRTTGQLVAIKKLLLRGEGRTRDEQRRRFEREMALYGKLRSAFVVRLLDAGFDEEQQPFMVLELVDGRELSHILRDQPLTQRAAQRVVGQVLEALAEAHSHGIVHRDLKPANIMVTGTAERPTARVLDFGIAGLARPLEGAAFDAITRAGQVRGTPAYMAPEQFELFDAPRLETDIYAMGLILQECLTGQRAIGGDDLNMVDIARRQLRGEIQIPALVLDSPFGPIVSRATALDAHARYRSADSMLRALEALDVPDTVLGAGHPTRPMGALNTASLDVDALGTTDTGELDARQAAPAAGTLAFADTAAGELDGDVQPAPSPPARRPPAEQRHAAPTRALPDRRRPVAPPTVRADAGSSRARPWLWLVLAVTLVAAAGALVFWLTSTPSNTPRTDDPDPSPSPSPAHAEVTTAALAPDAPSTVATPTAPAQLVPTTTLDAPAPAPDTTDAGALAERLLREGIAANDAAHFERARGRFEAVLALEPGQPDALLGLARAHLELDAPAAALELLERLGEDDERADELAWLRARAQQALDEREQARTPPEKLEPMPPRPDRERRDDRTTPREGREGREGRELEVF